ncbi:hypothetical protein MIR68_004376 [Amoeboaphelidium protococcarum]|nr:hypothetical protein MIR68_004376 [Amoeboaphelidium protococcarum]
MVLLTKFAAALSVVVSVSAQVVFRDAQLRRQIQEELTFVAENAPIALELPAQIDNAELASEQVAIEEQMAGVHYGEYTFGKVFEADVSLTDSSDRNLVSEEVIGDIRIQSLRIKSEKALSLNLQFDQFELSPSAEFYVINAVSGKVFGPYTSLNNKEFRQFAIAPIDTNELLLQLIELKFDRSTVHVSKVIHGFRPLTVGRSGSCNLDVACEAGDGWQDQVRSVAMILSNSGSGFCSGAMLNNAEKDGRQLYLTAYHCIGRKDVSNNLLLFNYEYQSCGDRSPASKTQTVHGMKKLAQWSNSDYSLVEVIEEIPEVFNVYLSGWSASNSSAESVVGIHHPSVDVKKISFSDISVSPGCWGNYCGRSGVRDHWTVPKWTRGTTEPGSSGSPLFDAVTKRVIGQLHGGAASCYNKEGYDSYGQIYHSYAKNADDEEAQMKPHLNPKGRDVDGVDGAYLNDLRKSKSLFLVQN